MQLYALDQNKIILAKEGQRQKEYLCPECKNPLRIRGGPHRQIHFYHLRANSECSQHQKSLTHLQVQLYLQSFLPREVVLEKSFPSIQRIADVAWEKEKIIFEIQCSPISLEEVKKRCSNYESLGYQVIWILHVKRFNKKKLSHAEAFLHQRAHYFTNIDEKGFGIIFDQVDHCRGHRRLYRSYPLKVHVQTPKKIPAFPFAKNVPQIISTRSKTRSFYFKGDLIDHYFESDSQSIFIENLLMMEEKFLTLKKTGIGNRLLHLISQAYHLFFNTLLEKLSN